MLMNMREPQEEPGTYTRVTEAKLWEEENLPDSLQLQIQKQNGILQLEGTCNDHLVQPH